LTLESGHADSSGAGARWELETPDGRVLRVFVDGPDLSHVLDRMLASTEHDS
jgi:hypothetical protein